MPNPPPPFAELLEVRLHRRSLLKAGAVAAALPFSALSAPPAAGAPPVPVPPGDGRIGFTPIAPTTGDEVVVPPGYTATVLLRWGDPLRPGLAPFHPDAQDLDG